MPGAVNENNEIFINAPNPCVEFFIMPKVLWVEECFGKSSLIGTLKSLTRVIEVNPGDFHSSRSYFAQVPIHLIPISYITSSYPLNVSYILITEFSMPSKDLVRAH